VAVSSVREFAEDGDLTDESSADPIVQISRASVAQRTGGWQQRRAAAAERAPAPFPAP
jgi:hypothetical protein